MSKIEVNQIASQIGGVLTIGASGDTVTLAAGALQSGFGRTGTVNWDTTPKTANFTAVSGEGYFLDTTTTTLTITLPSTPSAGDIVSVADYDGTAATNAITVGRNSSNINGDAADFTISKNYSAISFVYVDATAGWRSVDTSNIENVQSPFIVATGGTETTCGDYKIHTFTGPGTFTVTRVGTSAGSTTVDYLVVAGGGGGAALTTCVATGGGGGAGGFRTNYPSSCAGIPVTTQAYPITVGGGGATKSTAPISGPFPSGGGNSGTPSIFSTITATGGGGGGSAAAPAGGFTVGAIGLTGGSGGGGGAATTGAAGGAGNTPPTSPSQGNTGGTGQSGPPGFKSGGGGGASANGNPGTNPTNVSVGGAGLASSITGSPVTYAGGGGGAGSPGIGANGGAGGGGAGASNGGASPSGTVNTGGGGGGAGAPSTSSGAGGSGIVVIRYKFQ
jgi:hypothetical protein